MESRSYRSTESILKISTEGEKGEKRNPRVELNFQKEVEGE